MSRLMIRRLDARSSGLSERRLQAATLMFSPERDQDAVLGRPIHQRSAVAVDVSRGLEFVPQHGGNALGVDCLIAGAQELVREHLDAFEAFFNESGPIRLRIGEGLSGWVAGNRPTIVNSPADLDLGATAHATGLRTWHRYAGVCVRTRGGSLALIRLSGRLPS